MKTCGIYLITVKRPGKWSLYYVGQSVMIKNRRNEHFADLAGRRHGNKFMQHAWEKYGKQAFSFEVLEECNPDQLDELEQWWLDEMHHSPRCMNISRDVVSPMRGRKTSEAAKLKLSFANKGRRRSDEFKDLMRSLAKGRKASLETRQKQSAVRKGKPRSDETKEKIRNGNKGKKLSEAARKAVGESAKKRLSVAVKAVHCETGETLVFSSMKDTERLGFIPQNVSSTIRRGSGFHKGYRWSVIGQDRV